MTSKISFLKLVREDFRRRSWLMAAIALGLFLLMPVMLLLSVNNAMENVRYGYMELSYVHMLYKNFMVNDSMLSVVVIGIAIFTGISSFAYLHSRIKLDLYHSLPVKRKKFFAVQYLSGFLMFLAPYLICTALCLLIGAINGLLVNDVMVQALRIAFLRILEYTAAYGTAILGTVMTGKLLTAVLGTIVFCGYLPALIMIFIGMKSFFFHTYIGSTSLLEQNLGFLSPINAGIYAERKLSATSMAGKWYFLGVAILIFWTLLMTGLALWLHQIRKTEAAEISMAFPKTEGPVKVLLTVPMSLVVGLWLRSSFDTANTMAFYVGIAAGALILSMVIEFIYHLNMQEVLKHKRQILLSAVLAMGIAVTFQFDITGYDTWLPAREDVAQMALYNDEINGYFNYEVDVQNGYLSYSPAKSLDATLVDDFDEIYDLAEIGARSEAVEMNCTRIYVEYRLKNGKREKRCYQVPDEKLEEAYKELFSHEDFKQAIYPIYRRNADGIQSVSAWGRKGTVDLDLTEKERKEFLEIYKKELLTADYDAIMNHAVGSVCFNLEVHEEQDEEDYFASFTSTTISEDGYTICDTFTETIAYIKEKTGVDVTEELTPEDVSEIQLTDYRGESDGRFILVTEPEQIQEVLDCLTYLPSVKLSFGEQESIDVYVTLQNGDGLPGTMYFPIGKVPAFLDE